MSERPILFSAEMVRAILEGRKTQTRRVMNPQPPLENISCPYAVDRLWVRESFAVHSFGGAGENEWVRLRYPADGKTVEYKRAGKLPGGKREMNKKLPSIHMPRWASRINLEVVNVRAEKLHEISPFDVEAEGSPESETVFGGFVRLWDSINGPRGYSWDVNPWVWVIEFKTVSSASTPVADGGGRDG